MKKEGVWFTTFQSLASFLEGVMLWENKYMRVAPGKCIKPLWQAFLNMLELCELKSYATAEEASNYDKFTL